MKRFIAIGLLAFAIAGCTTISNISEGVKAAAGFTVTQSQLDSARAAYDGAFLAPMATYRQLPACKAGQTFILNRCRTPSLVRRLQAADLVVAKAFDDVQARITAGDNTGLSAAYETLQSAVSSAEKLAAIYGIQ